MKSDRMPLFQFRVKNSTDIRYISAPSLYEAAAQLVLMGFSVDYIQLAGELVSPETKEAK